MHLPQNLNDLLVSIPNRITPEGFKNEKFYQDTAIRLIEAIRKNLEGPYSDVRGIIIGKEDLVRTEINEQNANDLLKKVNNGLVYISEFESSTDKNKRLTETAKAIATFLNGLVQSARDQITKLSSPAS